MRNWPGLLLVQAIPPNIDKVTGFQSDAKFILLVEKDAAFMRLAEDRFYNRFPCVIITVRPLALSALVCFVAHENPGAWLTPRVA
jgi:DNA topoisomerase VI subunit A